MSDDEIKAPTPKHDPDPDQGPGGTDALPRDPDDFPIVTPDQPRAAQLDGDEVPDDILAPEDKDDGDAVADAGPSEGTPV